MVTPNFVI